MDLRRIFRHYKLGRIVIGYAIYLMDECCYEYNEDECFIFTSVASAEKLAGEIYTAHCPYRIVPIRIKNILKDFGCSCHKYAIEPGAMKIFRKVAQKNKIGYESRLWIKDDDLIVLTVNSL